MDTTKLKKMPLAILLALGFNAHNLYAANLNPGDEITLIGTTVAAEPQLAGLVLQDELIPFSFASSVGSISGTVQQRVVRSSQDNTLDFYWRVINDTTSLDSVAFWRVGDFSSPEYNPNWRIDGVGDVAPVSANRFTDSFESYVNFSFGNGIMPGESSKFFFFDTSATNYDKSAFYDLASQGTFSASAQFAAYTPAVPEPSSILMYTSGLAMLLAAARSRRKRA